MFESPFGYDVDFWCAGLGKHIPAFAGVLAGVNAHVGQGLQGVGVHTPTGRAACAECFDVFAVLLGEVIQHAFGQHAACRVVSAENEYVGAHEEIFPICSTSC